MTLHAASARRSYIAPAVLSIRSPALVAALDYAERGLRVFPIKPRGKTPLTEHGCKDATTDPAQIVEWWSRWPAANVGIATGDGIFVLDMDSPEAEAALARLEAEHGPLPPTWTAKTPRGRHLFLATTADVRNSAGELGPGLDVRGAGGYVVASPSINSSGVSYAWAPDRSPDDVALGDAPAWLVALLVGDRERTGEPRATARRRATAGRSAGYAGAALDNELTDVANAPEGTRNSRLNVAAFNLFQLVAGGVLQDADVRAALLSAALAAGLPQPEAEATIASGRSAGMREPRSAPARENRTNGHAGRTNGAAQISAGDVDHEAHATELGLSQRIVAQFGADLRFVHPRKDWLSWDGTRWARDNRGHVVELAKLIVAELHREAAATADPLERDKLTRFALRCEREAVMRAALKLSQSAVAAVPEDFDRDSFLLNTPTGTVDLTTGAVREHRREDLLTRLCPTPYDPSANAATFERFLLEIMAGDAEMALYLQRAFGYALTGCCQEHVLFMLIGKGANGKSTLTKALCKTIGDDYGAHVAPTLLFHDRQDTHPTGLADLQGKRLAVTHELDSGTRLAEGLVKSATGGDKIKARKMRQDFFEFVPTHTLFLCSNTRPVIRGTDDGIWRRLRLVPFRVQFPLERQDSTLGDKLAGEAPGILAWLVAGALAWRDQGLADPEVVRAATAGYRADQDVLGDFLDDQCTLGEAEAVSASALYERFVAWHKAALGGDPWTQTTFGRLLTDRGIEARKIGGIKRRIGVTLR